jgi:CDP-glycerol glycerophosphotransferase (TagB/SpsB family)
LFKPHTRIRSQKHVFDNIPLPDVSPVLTAELCDWADVLINVGSSVITDALMREKPVLYLKYLHDNTTLFEELGACWTIHNEDELKHALGSLKADKTGVPYGEANVAKFISEVVKGGDDSRDVLSTYEHFIVNCAAGGHPMQDRYGKIPSHPYRQEKNSGVSVI